MIRKTIKSTPFFYKIFFALFRQSKVRTRLPNPQSRFYFGGYPRSGNSYLTNLFEELHPGVEFSHHLHAIAATKIALSRNVPVVIIVRHPVECISSLLVMNQKDDQQRNQQLLQQYVAEYITYHSTILKRRKELEVIIFEAVTQDPNLFLSAVYRVAQPPIEPITAEERSLENLSKKATIGQRQKKMSDDHAVRYSSLPNEARKKLKEKVKKNLLKMEGIEDCIAIYETLKKSTL
ncbi:MAG: hypothetical protein AAGJ93_09765 [Bacteroidota bacterium]